MIDFNQIYNEYFQYSLPRTILESYFDGKAFDNTTSYSQEEYVLLLEDISDIQEKIYATHPVQNKVAVMTAGGPGAGKTFKLKQDLEAQAQRYAYIDPDDVCLKSQTRTYLADIAQGDNTRETWKKAYNKWRPASNAAAHWVLANLIREKYGFYFGATLTSPATGIFLSFLKRQGYTIRLIHVSAPDDVRWNTIAERDKTFVQTTEQDVYEKGLLLPQRINDTYLKFADQIDFCYRDGVKQDAVLAATWIRTDEIKGKTGRLDITDHNRYEKIKTLHDEMAEKLQRPDLLWKNSVEEASSIDRRQTVYAAIKRVIATMKSFLSK